MRYPNGDKFTGLFAEGKMSEGEMIYAADQESYIGHFSKDGVQEGQGIYKF